MKRCTSTGSRVLARAGLVPAIFTDSGFVRYRMRDARKGNIAASTIGIDTIVNVNRLIKFKEQK
jgi:hypothetical protein